MATEHEDGAESESGSSYKKKLQKQLFRSDDNTNVQHAKSAKKAKKRKLKEEPLEEYEKKSRAKFVKSEPESDIELPKKKKRHDRQLNENLHASSCSISEESYLDIKVKEEQSKFAKLNCVNRRKEATFGECDNISKTGDKVSFSDNHSKHDKFGKVNDSQQNEIGKKEDENMFHLKQEPQETNSKKEKKKKSKKYRDSTTNSDSMNLIEKFGDDEGCLEAFVQTKKRKSSKSLKKSCINNSDISADAHIVKAQNTSNNLPNDVLRDRASGNTSDETHNASHSTDENETPKLFNESSSQMKEKSQRITRISDRIRFEDEVNSEFETTHETGIKLLKVDKFRKAKNLKPISFKLQKQATVSHNDEIWIVRCPQDIDTNALMGDDLTIDHKCKIKVGGVTYEGSVDKESKYTALLTTDCAAAVIKLVSVNGVVNLRRRVPKPHFVEDKVMVNNQTDFIPLPETKCRHPLFGSDYKKATKLSESLRERLSGVVNLSEETGSPRKMNKKGKKKKHTEDNTDKMGRTTAERHVKLEPQVPEAEDKKRKRKHSSSEIILMKKSKRRKRDNSSTEVWESEKAIEENLFNY